MTVKVDLLPASYRRAWRRHRRGRLIMTVAAALLIGELGVGVVLHTRSARTRNLLAETSDTHEATETVTQQIEEPAREVALLTQQVTLATQLRTTHRWSRLLGMLSTTTPEKVVLTTLATNPPRWTPDRRQTPKEEPRQKSKQEDQVKPLINGIVMNGYAVDHGDLSMFVKALQASGAFASIDLKDARRSEFLSRDAIAFELRCHW